jgi:isocitrate dehydrogenase
MPSRKRKSVTRTQGQHPKFTEALSKWGYEVARDEFRQKRSLVRGQREVRRQSARRQTLIQDSIADIIFQHMIGRPHDFDVLATPNLNGDYLSDAVAAEVGGVGIAPGANVGDEVAVFEATHGTAPKYTNLDKVNPGSLLFSGVMLLEHIGWNEAAELIVSGFEATLAQRIVTYDFARQMQGAKEVRTSEFATAIISNM